jgi:hypothetical protein
MGRRGGGGASSATGGRRAVPEGQRHGGRRRRVVELSSKANEPMHGGRRSLDTCKEQDAEEEAVAGGHAMPLF